MQGRRFSSTVEADEQTRLLGTSTKHAQLACPLRPFLVVRMIRVVSAAVAKSLLPMADAIELNAKAFMLYHQGGVVNPDRLVVRKETEFASSLWVTTPEDFP
jgi:hypothetical protein